MKKFCKYSFFFGLFLTILLFLPNVTCALTGEIGGRTGAYPGERLGGVSGYTLPQPSSWEFSIFIFSCILLVTSLFFLYESLKISRLLLAKEEGYDPNSGEFISIFVSVIVSIIWVVYKSKTLSIPVEELLNAFYYPRELAPGLLLASIVPATVGLIKFSTAIAASSPQTGEVFKKRRIGLAYAVFNFINLAASIVTLLKLIHPPK